MAADTGQIPQFLRTADPDRYLSTLYAPAEKRAALTALYAFDAEIAGIRARVSEPLPGEIRLQWWRDVIAAPDPAVAAAGNPLAEALAQAIHEYRLPKVAFGQYLDARIFDLYDDPMPDRTALEAWAGETVSLIVQMAAQILNDGNDPRVADAAGHAGVALSLTRLLATAPVWLARGQMYVPADMLAAAGTSAESLRDGGEGAARAVAAMVALAREHLSKAEAAIVPLDAHLKPAFLPLATAAPLLDRVAKAGEGALRDVTRLSPLRRQWLIFRRAAAIAR